MIEPGVRKRTALSILLFSFLSITAFAGTALAEMPNGLSAGPAKPYLNGGIGIDEATSMRAERRNYRLRMTFASNREGQFISGVSIRILDPNGKTVFELGDAGPLLFVTLPDGRYRIEATFSGAARTQQVTLNGNAGKDISFRWNEPETK